MSRRAKHIRTGSTFTACTWQYADGFRITEFRGFESEARARGFAAKTSTEKIQVSIVKNKRRIAYYQDGVDTHNKKEPTMPPAKTETKKKAAARASSTATKSTRKPASPAPKTKKPTEPTSIKSWEDVLASSDGALTKAFPLKKALALPTPDEHTILASAKSNANTQRYDRAYLRFLTGAVGSCPSNPTSTGIADAGVRAKRRAAIRAALTKHAAVAGKLAKAS